MTPTGAGRPFAPCLLGNPVGPPPGVCGGTAGWWDAGECREGQRGTSARQESPDVWKMPLKETDAGILTKRSQEGFHGDGAPQRGRRMHSHGKAAWQVALLWVPSLCPRHSAPPLAQGCLQAVEAPEAVCPPSKMLANPRHLGACAQPPLRLPGRHCQSQVA